MLTLQDVRFGFPTRPDFLGPISLSIEPGQCWAIVGPNGAGKSTLLRLMAGLLRPTNGRIAWRHRRMFLLQARDRARQIAYLPQQSPNDLDLSVGEVVLMGRYPFRSLGLFESAEDYGIARHAMEVTETLVFSDRPLVTLSGGERQRVHLAAALAQQPRLLLLDEPTTSLDIQHQLVVFRILRESTLRDHLTVVAVTHDVNLAMQFCTDVLLLHEGKAVAIGPPSDVLTPRRLGPVYGVELVTLVVPEHGDQRWIVPVNVRHKGTA